MFQLFPDSIFFTSWLEKMKILLVVLQNSLQDNDRYNNQHDF